MKADPIDAAVGARVRARRVFQGISQQALAKVLGVTFQQIQKYEVGSNRISASALVRVARELACPVAYFFETIEQSDGAFGEVELSTEALKMARRFDSIANRNTRAALVQLIAAFGKGEANDLETTGVKPEDEICEIGFVDLMTPDLHLENANRWLVKPIKPMPPEACAVHHLTDQMLASAPDLQLVRSNVVVGCPDAYAAHNGRFELQYLPELQPMICTYKCALRLFPGMAHHGNQYLRYALNVPLGVPLGDPEQAMPPHRALPDAYLTAHILMHMIALAGVEQLQKWSDEPVILPRVKFGKHIGQSWDAVPTDYLDWMMRQADMDPDALTTARHHLKLRFGNAS